MAGENLRGAAAGGSLTRTGYSFDTIAMSTGLGGELEEILRERIDRAPDAYRNAPIVLDISGVKDLSAIDYEALTARCRAHRLFLIGLSGAVTEDRARALTDRGIPVVNSSRYARVREENLTPKVITKTLEVKVPVEVRVPVEVPVPAKVAVQEPMIVLKRNVRSGEIIKAPGNSVAVFGSVANGARIIASHNVMIFGDLMGEVYAGSPRSADDPGQPEAFIFTEGAFKPTFVAIAGNYQTADNMERDPLSGPVQGHERDLVVSLSGKALRYSPAKDFSRLTKLGSGAAQDPV